MTAQRSKPKTQLDVMQAAKRLGLSESFLSWALESGLLQGSRDRSGAWTLTFGESEPQSERRQPLDQGETAPREKDLPAARANGQGNGKDVENQIGHPTDLENEILRRMTAERLRRPATSPNPAPEPEAEPRLRPVASASAPASQDIALQKVEQIYQEQVAYLRRLLETREVVISQKDALIVQLTERIARLAELAMERPQGGPSGASAREAVPETLPETAADPGPNQQRINQRHDDALKNVRDTLLMVREYLAQLDPKQSEKS